ncbi:hypothetical protein ACWG8W_06555 [Citricoccus zhacaiensis]
MTSAKSASESKQASVEAVRNNLFGGPHSAEFLARKAELERGFSEHQEFCAQFSSPSVAYAASVGGFTVEQMHAAGLR